MEAKYYFKKMKNMKQDEFLLFSWMKKHETNEFD